MLGDGTFVIVLFVTCLQIKYVLFTIDGILSMFVKLKLTWHGLTTLCVNNFVE